jgi:hypothetical protein
MSHDPEPPGRRTEEQIRLEELVFEPVDPERCWAVVVKNRSLAQSSRFKETCYFRRLEGKLVCKRHLHLDGRAKRLNKLNCRQMGIDPPDPT